MDKRIAVITPYPGLQQVAEEVVRERSAEWQYGISVLPGDLAVGLETARTEIEAGAEVIVSRGGTASLITKQVDVPVVEIRVTLLDVIRALTKAGGDPERVGIAGFRNVIYGCEDLGQLWGITLREITIESEAEADAKILQAAAEGIRLIVGDAIAVKNAVRLGLEGILIQSGKDAVYQALKEAQLLTEVRRREQERAELMKVIIDSSADGIVATDAQGRITVFNPAAADIFHVERRQVLGRPVKEIIPNTRLPVVITEGNPEWGDIQLVGERRIATKRLPIKIRGQVVGAVASFQDVTQLQHYEQVIRQKLHAKGLTAKTHLDDIISTSNLMAKVKTRARQYAVRTSTVLITGESGVGKEMFSQSIHNLSDRRLGPFVAVNCAALPEHLLESELFGYAEGAFTGAKKGGKTGLFELAHNGTLFMDEIGEMPITLQSRLLRVLQEREVMRLGGDSVIPVNVRIIAATNEDLAELVTGKKFRRDLLYRLDVLRLHIPPLRDRPEDIRLLIEYFTVNMCGRKPDQEAIHLLEKYEWPGNVRELANIAERAVLFADGGPLTIACFREALEYAGMSEHAEEEYGTLADLTQRTIEKVLAEEHNNFSRAAARLGVNRTTLWRKLRR